MKIVGRTWFHLMTLTCGSWSQGQHALSFKVQWPCLICWRQFDVWTSLFGIMSQYGQVFDLKTYVYFMVHWFCLISRRQFDVWTSYFGIMSITMWPNVWLQNKCRSLWPIFHGPLILPLYLEDCLLYEHHHWDYESVWPDIWPQNIWRSLTVTYISWSSDFALYFQDYLVDECHTFR